MSKAFHTTPGLFNHMLNTCGIWALVIFIISCIYMPFLLNGGIITDDWGDILESINCNSFWQCYGDWFPLFSNRPLAPLPITLTTRIFSTNYWLYPVTNTAIYLIAIGVTAKAVTPFLNSFSRQLFVLLASVPCIAMPVITSPINQLTATVAFLYWAISLQLLLRSSFERNKNFYLLSYLILLCGFLTYEIILPLLVMTAFLPALLFPTKSFKCYQRYFLRFIVPILAVLLLVITWQKILAPTFMEVFSRLNFDPSHLTRNLYTWISVFSFQLPILFTKALQYLDWMMVVIFALIAILFWLGTSHLKRSATNPNSRNSIGFLLLSTGTFFASSLIFILTDESAVSWGYQARGLSSTWFAFALLLASLTQHFLCFERGWKFFFLALVFVFTCFSILSFRIQLDKYIESWKLQLQIIDDISSLSKYKKLGLNPTLIANVPRFVPNNYNRELVFSQSWDLPAALTINTKNPFITGVVIDSRIGDLQGLRVDGTRVYVNDGGSVDLKNLWLYDFDPQLKQGILTPIESSDELQIKINQWAKK